MGLFAVLLSLASVATVSLAGVVPVGAPVAAPLNAAYPFAPAAYAVPNGLAYSSAGLAYASPYAAYTSPLAAQALASPFAYSPYAASPYTASPYAAAYTASVATPLTAAPYVAAPYVAAPVARAVAAPYVAAPVARAVAAPLVAAPVAAVAPVARAAIVAAPIEADSYPQYNFAYTVQDALTGDSKSQEESRDGGVVKGSYSLIEPDGVRRTVNYYADPINGFNAVVQRDVPVAVAAAVRAAPVRAAPAIVAV